MAHQKSNEFGKLTITTDIALVPLPEALGSDFRVRRCEQTRLPV